MFKRTLSALALGVTMGLSAAQSYASPEYSCDDFSPEPDWCQPIPEPSTCNDQNPVPANCLPADFRETRVLFVYDSTVLDYYFVQNEATLKAGLDQSLALLNDAMTSSDIDNPPSFVLAATDSSDGVVALPAGVTYDLDMTDTPQVQINKFNALRANPTIQTRQISSEADVVVFVAGRYGAAQCVGVAPLWVSSDTASIGLKLCDGNWQRILSHEIGHTYGGRHNIQADPLNIPYAYGHGLCVLSPTRSVATVMATGSNYCFDPAMASVEYLNAFSSAQLIVDEGLTVTPEQEASADMARVIEERAYVLATAFEYRSNGGNPGGDPGTNPQCSSNPNASFSGIIMSIFMLCSLGLYARMRKLKA